ncbi:uncharacterized protein G2W53_042154 [Senna tora]|uniref:Uncharacterized protein n=1 Tax=Senna tora TaxID=362788 RepID=A0A834VYR3_9FABA|nr:uncharacterized protein G2W53_042154 [Senna tora]
MSGIRRVERGSTKTLNRGLLETVQGGSFCVCITILSQCRSTTSKWQSQTALLASFRIDSPDNDVV